MDPESSRTYPAVTLKGIVIFPTEKISLVLGGKEVGEAVSRAHKSNHRLVLLFQKNGNKSEIGITAQIIQHLEMAPGILGLIVEGLKRVKVTKVFTEDDTPMVEVVNLPPLETLGQEAVSELEALSRGALERFKKIIQAEGLMPLMVADELQKEYLTPTQVSDVISAAIKMDLPEKIQLLETLDVHTRLEILNTKLANELNIAQAEARIQQQMEKDITKAQKEFVLREKMKAIEKELGETSEQQDYEDVELKIEEAGLPEESKKRVLAEARRLKQMPSFSPEQPYIKNYLEWITELPWNKRSSTAFDLKKAKKVLDADHYGLEKAKERVLEYLAVEKLTQGKGRGTILCFVGPPGTGKTSVGQSIARALGRKFARISLGGIRDEAEIRGHRRTYVGALPGRIIQGIRNAGTKNPVFMMDEIDKIGADFRGDPASALLEVLDPAQNSNFSDHYIEIPFDLSEVFFITTANILDPVPPALRDRMEVIEFPGYTDEEKFQIAKKFLLPRVLSSTGLTREQLVIKDKAIKGIINRYTREAGVRDLERKLSEIARKVAKEVAEDESFKPLAVDTDDLGNYLGPEVFEPNVREQADEVGVAAAPAWMPTGGEIIFIEVTLVPGKGNLTMTGQLGNVMQESAKAALSYIRSRSEVLGFDKNFYYQTDIHIHVPEGAVPKDGPSAGVAIATALASALTRRKVNKEVALTGEITLSGKVLPVGGIKEKVLAAHRAGIRTMVLPITNEKNLVDIPQEVKNDLNFALTKHMDDVLEIALIAPKS